MAIMSHAQNHGHLTGTCAYTMMHNDSERRFRIAPSIKMDLMPTVLPRFFGWSKVFFEMQA